MPVIREFQDITLQYRSVFLTFEISGAIVSLSLPIVISAESNRESVNRFRDINSFSFNSERNWRKIGLLESFSS